MGNNFITPMSEFCKGLIIGAAIVAAMIWAIVLLSGCSVKTYNISAGRVDVNASVEVATP